MQAILKASCRSDHFSETSATTFGRLCTSTGSIPSHRLRNVSKRAKHASAKSLAVAGRLFRARQAGKFRGLPRDGSFGQSLSWARLAGPSFLSTPREESSRRSPLAAELGALACQDR